MSENLRKLIGVAVMAAIVVVGVVATNGDDSDFARTRNNAFGLPKGAGLDAQIQQPGDAENDLVIAMAAAAKCDEGHVLISTGDPVSPWRCGPLLSEMATVGIEDRVSQIEASLEQALPLVGDALRYDGPTAEEILVLIENLVGQPLGGMNSGKAERIARSGFLIGVPLQIAEQVVRSLGLGFRHEFQDGRDLDPIEDFGTFRDPIGYMAAVIVDTRRGVVSEARYDRRSYR